MKKLLFLFLLVNSLFTNINSQWYIQNEIPTFLNSVKFINSNVGFILGSDGLILKTTDGGDNWMEIPSNTINKLADIYFIDETRGWICGSNGTVLITSDGGENWNNISTSINTHFRSIFFLTEDYGWVAGDKAIYKTTNGGQNWEVNRMDTIFHSITFKDSLTGFVSGEKLQQQHVYGFIDLTTDGGETWTTKFETNLGYLTSLLFVEDSIGYAVGENGAKVKSTDGGNSWFLITPSGIFIENWESAFFINRNVGWVAGGSGRLIDYTTDGGINWTRQLDFLSNAHSLYSIFFSDSITGWAVGVKPGGGEILKTTNGGVTFIESENGNVIRDFKLSQNYPNPFNPSTRISWQSPAAGHQTIKVFDVLGNEIATLVDEYKPAGSYEVEFNAAGLSSGIYFYTLTTGIYTDSKKMLLIR
jgi:photosystem II stability/assembly factor-like uncharacterized protein